MLSFCHNRNALQVPAQKSYLDITSLLATIPALRTATSEKMARGWAKELRRIF
jgi:hypothetical protein